MRSLRSYQARLKALNAVDFGDLLLHNITIFAPTRKCSPTTTRSFPTSSWTSTRTRTSRSICGCGCWRQGRNICCVGDDDQSIYGWRGAEVDNILRFEKDFPGAKVIRLERNYRSTPHILAAASGLIAANKSRLGKTLWTDLPQGERVSVRGVWDAEEEARTIARRHRAGRTRRPQDQQHRHSRPRFLPDAKLRRAFRAVGHSLSRRRWPTFLRASGNPRRPRLSARDHSPKTTSPSSASSTSPSADWATPPCRPSTRWHAC
jgi:superfamily I DNA/RNA helicase